MHGGGSPQAKKAARARLDDLVDPSLAVFRKALRSRDGALAWRAARDILRAAGLDRPVDDAVPAEQVAALVRWMGDLFVEVVEDDGLRERWMRGVTARVRPRLLQLMARQDPL